MNDPDTPLPGEPGFPKRTLAVRVTIAVVIAAAVVSAACCFVASQNERVVVLRFGAVQRVIDEPGLYFRMPWPIDSLKRLDGRLQVSEIRISEALTADKRNVILPVYFAWRVEDPLKFVQAVGRVEDAGPKLDAIITSYRNSVLGTRDFDDLVAPGGGTSGLRSFEAAILEQVDRDAGAHFGIAVEQVGVKQLSLPEANIASVFRRMRAERKQFADAFRAEGKREAEALRAQTEAEKATLLSSARRYAEETRGRAEAEAARTYAAAHGKDMEFYRYLRELQALRAVVDKNTTVILDTGMAPFRLLKPPSDTSQGTAPKLVSENNEQALADARKVTRPAPTPLERTDDGDAR